VDGKGADAYRQAQMAKVAAEIEAEIERLHAIDFHGDPSVQARSFEGFDAAETNDG
jgi:hypothetical protein